MDSASLLVSTVELTLLAEVWVNQPWCCKHGNVVPITHLSCGGMGRVKIPPITTTIYAQGRWKSWPLHFAWAIQQSWPWRCWCWRIDPEDLNARELYSSLQAARTMLESSPGAEDREKLEDWPTLKLPKPRTRAYMWAHPNLYPICDLLEQEGPVLSCGPRAARPPLHEATTGCSGRVLVRTRHWWCGRDQGLKPDQ